MTVPAQSATGDDAQLARVRDAALADAARRTGLDPSRLSVRSAARVTWPDGSLGCGRPGVRYTMAPVSGWHIVIAADDGRELDYRAGRRGVPLLCERGGGTTDR